MWVETEVQQVKKKSSITDAEVGKLCSQGKGEQLWEPINKQKSLKGTCDETTLHYIRYMNVEYRGYVMN